jgi:hypothetical protein
MCQPPPRPPEEELEEMGYHEIIPQSFRDHDIDLWLPYPRHARMLLDEPVTHELTVLRAREKWLRTNR